MKTNELRDLVDAFDMWDLLVEKMMEANEEAVAQNSIMQTKLKKLEGVATQNAELRLKVEELGGDATQRAELQSTEEESDISNNEIGDQPHAQSVNPDQERQGVPVDGVRVSKKYILEEPNRSNDFARAMTFYSSEHFNRHGFYPDQNGLWHFMKDKGLSDYGISFDNEKKVFNFENGIIDRDSFNKRFSRYSANR